MSIRSYSGVASWKSSTAASRSKLATWRRRQIRSHAEGCSIWPKGTTPRADPPAAPGRCHPHAPAPPRRSSPVPAKHEERRARRGQVRPPRPYLGISRRTRPKRAAGSFWSAVRSAAPREAYPKRRELYPAAPTVTPERGAEPTRGFPSASPSASLRPRRARPTPRAQFRWPLAFSSCSPRALLSPPAPLRPASPASHVPWPAPPVPGAARPLAPLLPSRTPARFIVADCG